MTAIESPSKEYVKSQGLHKVGNIHAGVNEEGARYTYVDLPGSNTKFIFYFNKHYNNDVKLVKKGETEFYKSLTVIPKYNVYKKGTKATIALPRYTQNKIPFLFMPKTASGRGQWKRRGSYAQTQREYYIFNLTHKHIIIPEETTNTNIPSALYFDISGKYGGFSDKQGLKSGFDSYGRTRYRR